MTPNTEMQLARALEAIARQFEMESFAKGEKTLNDTLNTLRAAAQAVEEDSEAKGGV